MSTQFSSSREEKEEMAVPPYIDLLNDDLYLSSSELDDAEEMEPSGKDEKDKDGKEEEQKVRFYFYLIFYEVVVGCLYYRRKGLVGGAPERMVRLSY